MFITCRNCSQKFLDQASFKLHEKTCDHSCPLPYEAPKNNNKSLPSNAIPASAEPHKIAVNAQKQRQVARTGTLGDFI